MHYRVTYGETMPAWSQVFPSKQKAERFALKQLHCGDIIFAITKVDRNDQDHPSQLGLMKALKDRFDKPR